MIEKKLDTLQSAGLESSATKDQEVDMDNKENEDSDWDDDFDVILENQNCSFASAVSNKSNQSRKSMEELISPNRKLKQASASVGQLRMEHFYDKEQRKSTKRTSDEDSTQPTKKVFRKPTDFFDSWDDDI